MRYRQYGRRPFTVSAIGMGGHREGMEMHDEIGKPMPCYYRSPEERARIVGEAIERGVTYFDTSVAGELIGLAESLRLLGRREGLFISAMRVDFFRHYLREGVDARQYTRRRVEALLAASGLDFLDQFMLGALDCEDPLGHAEGAAVAEALNELALLREEGRIRCIACTTHDPDYAARLLDKYPTFDAVMTPYNFANRAAEGTLQDALRATGAAWIAMKTLIWQVYGIPVTVLRRYRAFPGQPEFDPATSIAQLAHRFALQNPLLTTCVPAMNSLAEVEENTAATDEPLQLNELRQLEMYNAAAVAEESVPLAIAGLLADTARVRLHSLRLLCRKLEIELPAIEWNVADHDAETRRVALAALAVLRGHPRWAEYVIKLETA